MNSEQCTAAARQELLEGIRVFAVDHGLSAAHGDAETLVKKFLVLNANGVDVETSYPVIASDINKIKFRGQNGRMQRYRDTRKQTTVFSPAMWKLLFSTADVSALANSASEPDLEVYNHFKRDAAGSFTRSAPEWKKALGFYLPSLVQRNAHDICQQVLPGTSRSALKNIVRTHLTPEEYATGLASMVKAMQFKLAQTPEFLMVLRDPTRQIENQDIAQARRVHEEENSVLEIPVWERSESFIPAPAEAKRARAINSGAPAYQRIARQAPELLTFARKKHYRQLAPVKAAMSELLKTGEHTPPKVAFRGYMESAYQGAPFPECVVNAHTAVHDPEFQQVLTFLNFMPIEHVMDTTEMRDFLSTVSRHISREAFSGWTDRDAVKKLLTVHGRDWVTKWDPAWTLDEPMKRAIIAHRNEYTVISQPVLQAVLDMEPIVG